MRVKRELWRTTMAPARSTSLARSAASTSAREKNSDQERKDERRERESRSEYERENPMNKQIIKKFGMAVRTVSYLRRYCSMFQIFETFRTSDES